MKTYLFDVSLLIAWLWPKHEAHKLVGTWFLSTGSKSWATCPITQAGFIRIISNPKMSGDTVSPLEAQNVLEANTKLPGHRFWPMDMPFGELTSPIKNRIFGHRQVTDAYLLGLAMRKGGILVTLDQAVKDLAGKTYSANLLILEHKKN